jgi:uncharacterized protein (TIGR02453 family)
MLQSSTLSFLKALKKNNNREWFQTNKTKYEAAKDDFTGFVNALISDLGKVHKPYLGLDTKDCIFRIYRDVRFSKNKDPYKTNMGAYFSEGGKKSSLAGFYIQVEPGNSFIAGGCWMPPPAVLKAIRQEIDYNRKPFEKIISRSSFKKLFGELSDTRLKTTPKGYASDHPAIQHLKQTSFIVTMPLRDEVITSKKLNGICRDALTTMKPFLEFLNAAIREVS